MKLGRTEPRLWTPPLRELTPDTSYGFDVIDFARDVLNLPLDPWEEWAVIHLGELLPDWRPRFRVMLILVARQNGKTLLGKVLIAYWMFVECLPLVLGTSTDRKYAKRAWSEIIELIKQNPWLNARLGPDAVRLTIGEEALTTIDGAEYIFAANNRRAARSTTLHRWLCDELREHHTWDAWNAATYAQNAVPGAQTVCITNQGDDTSIVLDSLRTAALEYLETGKGDPRLGLIEYSMPDGADVADLDMLAYSNPNLGRRIDPDALLGAAIRAKKAGGEELSDFRTEVGCQRVHQMDPAVDPDAWQDGGTDSPVDLAEHRNRVALCVDVARDGSHATVAAGAVIDGIAHTEIVAAWDGFGCTARLRAELPDIVANVKPRAVGWFPTGPAAAITADLTSKGWTPRRCEVEEIRTESAAVCMGLAELVRAGQVVHPKDPLQTQHVNAATKLWRGDMWVFGRKGASPVDAAYATAGAVHLARTLPPELPPLTAV